MKPVERLLAGAGGLRRRLLKPNRKLVFGISKLLVPLLSRYLSIYPSMRKTSDMVDPLGIKSCSCLNVTLS